MADDLPDLDRRITDALSALRRARAIAERVANSTTLWHEDMAERALNGLLDRRFRSGQNPSGRDGTSPALTGAIPDVRSSARAAHSEP